MLSQREAPNPMLSKKKTTLRQSDFPRTEPPSSNKNPGKSFYFAPQLHRLVFAARPRAANFSSGERGIGVGLVSQRSPESPCPELAGMSRSLTKNWGRSHREAGRCSPSAPIGSSLGLSGQHPAALLSSCSGDAASSFLEPRRPGAAQRNRAQGETPTPEPAHNLLETLEQQGQEEFRLWSGGGARSRA